jgi:hypothetical protein
MKKKYKAAVDMDNYPIISNVDNGRISYDRIQFVKAAMMIYDAEK